MKRHLCGNFSHTSYAPPKSSGRTWGHVCMFCIDAEHQGQERFLQLCSESKTKQTQQNQDLQNFTADGPCKLQTRLSA